MPNRKGKTIGDSTLALVAERRAQAVLLRNQGLSYPAIAEILHYTDHTTVLHFVQTHNAEIVSNPIYKSIYAKLSFALAVENLP